MDGNKQAEPVGALSDHPIQPLKTDEQGVIRFKENSIVTFLANGKLNELAKMGFPREDWVQLAQLIGYSLSGWGTLSYVSDEDWERANQTHPAPAVAQEPVGHVIGKPGCMEMAWLPHKKQVNVGDLLYTEAPAVAQDDVMFEAGKAAGRQEVKDAQSEPDFWAWVRNAYREPESTDFTIHNMEVAYQAGRAAAVAQEPVVQRTLGYEQGIQDAAKMLDTKADDYAKEFGFDDMGALEFSREAQREYHSTLVELAEEVRSMEATNLELAVAQPPADVVRELYETLMAAEVILSELGMGATCEMCNATLTKAKEHGL